MLDIPLYRMSESLARQAMRTWRYGQVHRVDAFEKAGFPVRLNNMGELDQIVGSMHDNAQFGPLQEQLGGFDEADLKRFVEALADFYEFYVATFRRPEVTVPLSEMLSHLTIYKMLLAYDPNFRSVLEIGPGNGLLSFFMARHAGLQDYTQIEACESFYLLQSLINGYLFGPEFDEWARPRGLEQAANCFLGSGHVSVQQLTAVPELNPVLPLDVVPVCRHSPWWRIADLAEQGWQYDIVTSNANLGEFTPEALSDYASLTHDILADDGILYVQCFGSPVNGSHAQVIERLYAVGLRALLLLPQGGVLTGNDEGQQKRLALGNGVFVKQGHPRFDAAAPGPLPNHASDCDVIHRMCFGDSQAGRRLYDANEIMQAVAAEVRRRRTAPNGRARVAA